jgi:signal transduction histidine kinase
LAGQPTLYEAGGTSRMATPLIVKGELVGVLTLAAAPGAPYDERDLELAQELARRMALAVENARLYAAARDALRARDELFAVAAHEIRGPLMSLHLAVQSLASGTLPETENRRLLQIIERDDRRLSRFVDELLDVGRLRSGQLQLELEPVDLAVVVHDVVSWLGADISRSGSPVSIHTEGSAVGTWDRFRLDQVVQNLVSNAVKFGRGEPIEISVTADDSRATLVVRDHGVGIPGERKEAIFEPFERRVSARHYGGLGLGLHIVQTVVSAFGGSIRVESEPGAGAEFVVELPK